MKLSIVIPCYNEKNTIEKIIEAVRTRFAGDYLNARGAADSVSNDCKIFP